MSATFIETSTPGLRGQSGGPLLDVKGEVWGVQSRTLHLDLGFKPTVKEKGKDVVVTERQFMHVGLATHVRHVVNLFNAFSVPYQSV
jgi:S1-C subfamily serine protease